jgi:type VI secretion system protein ImpC
VTGQPDIDFTVLLERSPAPAPEHVADEAALPVWVLQAVATLQITAASYPGFNGGRPQRTAEALIAELDRRVSAQLNLIIHHAEFQALEAAWRGLHFLVRSTDTDALLKIRVINVGKRELSRTLRKFRGTAWDQSPIFRKIYEEEYGQFGGEPFGVLIGDYQFDHHPEDVQLLADMAKIAASAHAPFLTGAAPSVMQMSSWRELANPRDLTRIFQTPEYAAWRSMRTDEDSRYVGLCMPHVLGRLPYGVQSSPLDDFAFEEEADGDTAAKFLWINAAFAMAVNITRAFSLYGWCTRIRGVDTGGVVEGLIAHRFRSADGATDLRCVTEVSLSERREAELSRSGFIPLLHRKNTDFAAFISAQSLQQPTVYADPAATTNAILAARLPYLFACCRFAQYLKCMVRDKVGSSMTKVQLTDWLQSWLMDYIDGSPNTSSEEWKAAHPLQDANVVLEEKDGAPGQYEARFFLRPHYQLEGMSDVLMYFIRKGSDPIEAESSSAIDNKSDAMTRDFKPGKFFEVTDFTLGIKLKDSETHGAQADDTGEEGSYARWRAMGSSDAKPNPVYKADIDDFSISRMIDVSSPILLKYCLARDRFDKAVLVKRARTPSGIVLGFLRLEFTQVLIKSISWADGEAVRETCKFRYASVDVKYIRRQMVDSSATTLNCKWESKPNG